MNIAQNDGSAQRPAGVAAASKADNDSLETRALALAASGFKIFPLAPGAKVPALETDWKRIATDDPDAVRRLWTCPVTGWPQPFNIGVALPPDILVVDVDVRDGKRGKESLALLESLYDPLPATYRIRTPSKGDHHYFRVDPSAGPFAAQLAEHVDLKTTGGFVVGEGSVIDGRAYARVGDAGPNHMQQLPDVWLPAIRRPEVVRAGSGGGAPLVELDEPSAIRRATEWLQTTAPDHGTYAVACRVKDLGVSEGECLALMLKHWRDRLNLDKTDEHVAFRVGNAYRYGQNAPGVKSPEAEFEAVEIDDLGRTEVTKPRLFYVLQPDVSFETDSVSLIDDWYDQGTMVVTYGESGSGKTHVVLSQAFAIATGEPWAGYRTHRGLVVYVAAEGGRGIRKRIAAWRNRIGATRMFALVPCPIDLLHSSGDTKPLIDLVHEVEQKVGETAAMIVIDTLSRALAGGNENAPDDMGTFVMHCDRIRVATGATVHVIHHSGKNRAAGARGHSLLRAATDSEIEIADGSVSGNKQRDMPQDRKLAFSLEEVRLGVDSEGRPITTALPLFRAEAEFEAKLVGKQADVVEAVREAVRQKAGVAAECELTPEITGRTGVSQSEIRATQPAGRPGWSRDSIRVVLKQLSKDNLLAVTKQGNGKEDLYFLAPA